MPTVKVYNMAGQETGELELNAAIFGIEPNVPAMHAVVKNYLANCRQGTQSTLTRSEVRGGGIKPWRQKGTGRARQGSIRAPQWIHGGIALGPKPRTYRYSLNKKLKRLAMLSALSSKAAAGEVVVIDSLEMGEIKTKSFVSFLKAVDCADTKSLVVTDSVKTNIVKSAANIPGVRTTLATTLNVYDILNAEMFIVDKAAVAKIEEVFA
ncbi:MAG: 50S ribosomal protein L4 [Butyricicoccus sp.]|nr:50S ribosomal protein L4 [Butyricicoccus sp.]